MSNLYMWIDSSTLAADEFYFKFCNPAVFDAAVKLIFPQIFVNIFYSIVLRFCKDEEWFYLISATIGIAFMYFHDSEQLYCLLIFAILSYALLVYIKVWITFFYRHIPPEYIYGIISIGMIIYFEVNGKLGLYVWEPHRIMIIMATLKVFSLSTEIERNVPLVNMLTYIGYMFCPATVLRGPFMSIYEYSELYGMTETNKWNLRRIWRIILCTGKTIICSLFGDCIVAKCIPIGTGKWFEAFRKGLSFRLNYYGHNYAAGAQLVAAGYNNHPQYEKGKWDYVICRPTHVEFPRCLASGLMALDLRLVVFVNDYLSDIYLNHEFALITNIYFLTALMHVENVEPVIFINSIFVFTYVMYEFRTTVSKLLSACALTEGCSKDEECIYHFYTSDTLFCKLINFVFSCITVLLMTYLFVLIDDVGFLEAKSVYINCSQKLSVLKFAGHHLLFGFSLFLAMTNR